MPQKWKIRNVICLKKEFCQIPRLSEATEKIQVTLEMIDLCSLYDKRQNTTHVDRLINNHINGVITASRENSIHNHQMISTIPFD